MSRRAHGRTWRAALVAVLVATALVVAPAVGGPLLRSAGGSARAATSPTQLEVGLSAVSAASIKPGGTFTVAGTVRNTGTAPVTNLRASLRLDWKTLDAAGLDAWAARQPTDYTGIEWDGAVDRPAGPLEPGASATFTLTGRADVLGLPQTVDGFGPRGLAVEVTGTSAGTRQLGVLRTFVVWDPGQAKSQTRLSVLLPVTTAEVTGSQDAAVAGSGLEEEWGPNGRLTRLVRASADPGISWAIDPALLVAAQYPTTSPNGGGGSNGAGGTPGPTVSTGPATSPASPPSPSPPSPSAPPSSSGDSATGATAAATSTTTPAAGTTSIGTTSTTGTAGVAATPGDTGGSAGRGNGGEWLRLLVDTAKGHDLYGLPWADPDAAALAHSGGTALWSSAQDDSAAATRQVFGSVLDVTLAVPPGGVADQQTVELYGRALKRTVVLDAGSVGAAPKDGTPAGGRVSLPGVRSDVSALLTDAGLSRDVAAMGTGGSAVAIQRVLARLAATSAASATAAAAGVRGTTAQTNAVKAAGRGVLATLPRGWDPQPEAMQQAMALLRQAPWVQLETVRTARSRSVTGGPATLPYRAVANAELPGDHVQDVVRAYERLAAFAPALETPGPTVTPLRRQALSLVGLGWRSPQLGEQARDEALRAARRPLVSGVDRLYDAVRLLAPAQINLLGDGAGLPLTLQSSLSQPVTLQLSLHPLSGRLRATKTVEVTLPAAADPNAALLKTVRVPVDAIANGDVLVEVRLLAPGGAQPLISADRPILVHVRLDWEDRGLVVAGLLLLVLLVVGLVRSVRRGRKRLPPGSAPDPDDVGSAPTRTPSVEPSVTPSVEQAHVPAADELAAPVEPVEPAEPVARTVAAQVLVPEARVSVGVGGPALGPGGEPGTGQGTGQRPAGWIRWDPDSTPAAIDVAPPSRGNGTADGGPVGANPGANPGADAGAESGGEDGRDALMRSSALMTAGTLVSRVLGMVRVAVLSAAIGAALSADAFNTANTLPNNLFILIGGGVLNAVLVPQIVRAAKQADGGKDYVDRLLTLAIVVLGGATVVLTAAAPLLVRLYSERWTADTLGLGTAFALWCLPQIFFYGLYTVFGQVLNARGSYGPYMWAPVVNNVVAIAGMLVYVLVYGTGARDPRAWGAGDVALLAGTTTLGVVAQALVLVPVLRRAGYVWRPRFGWRGVGLRTAGAVAAWTFAGVALSQAAFVVTSKITNAAGEALARTGGPPGGRTVFDYAYLLFMLPHSLVAVSLVTAVFTRMSQAAHAGRADAVRDDLSLAVRTVGVATVLATATFLVLGSDLAYAMFVHTPREVTDRYALVAAAMLLGLVPFSAQYLFQRVCYAYEDARTPFVVGAVGTLVWTLGNLVAWIALPPRWVVVGVGLAMSLSSLVGAALMVPRLRRRLGSVDGVRILGTHARLVVAAAAAAALTWVVQRGLHGVLGEGRAATYAVLLVAGTVLLATYAGLLRMLRVGELDDLVRPVLTRLPGVRAGR